MLHEEKARSRVELAQILFSAQSAGRAAASVAASAFSCPMDMRRSSSGFPTYAKRLRKVSGHARPMLVADLPKELRPIRDRRLD